MTTRQTNNDYTEVVPLHPQLAISPLFRILSTSEVSITNSTVETRTVTIPSKGNAPGLTATVPTGLTYDDAAIYIALLSWAVMENLGLTWETYWWPKDKRFTRDMPVRIDIRRSSILRILGISSSKSSYNRIEESIQRLNATVIVENTPNNPRKFRLIRLLNDMSEKRVEIGINAYNADAILKKQPIPKQNHFVDTSEIRQLRAPTAKAIYFALIAMIDPGAKSRTTFERLYRTIHDEPMDPFKARRLLAALCEFRLPGWTVEVENKTTKPTIRLERPPLRQSSSVCNWKCNAADPYYE